MRKIKLELKCRVPSWNFCNHDGFTDNNRYSKELCRFCVVSKNGHYCALHDEWLTTDPHFVHKTTKCIDATAGFQISVDEEAAPQIDPKMIARETIKEYKKLVNGLMAQNFPRNLAETIAQKQIIGD